MENAKSSFNFRIGPGGHSSSTGGWNAKGLTMRQDKLALKKYKDHSINYGSIPEKIESGLWYEVMYELNKDMVIARYKNTTTGKVHVFAYRHPILEGKGKSAGLVLETANGADRLSVKGLRVYRCDLTMKETWEDLSLMNTAM